VKSRRWLAERGELLARLPSLEGALLGDSPFRYATHRLKYLGVRALLQTSFRLLELALFAAALPFEVLGPVLVVRSVLFAGEALWWGALETLRRDVRELHGKGRPAVTVVRGWLALAVSGAVLVLGATASWVGFGPSTFPGFDVIELFTLCCGVRFAVDLIVRAHHSGVYALRRVYRPVWSLFAVDLADVVMLVIAYLWLGAWGLGPSVVVSGLARAALSVKFVARTYAELRIELGGPLAWFRSLPRTAFDVKHSLMSAIGNAVTELDAFVVLGLLAAPASASGSLLLAALFHGIAPLQAVAFSWARPFYFDFKRLEGWGSPYLLERFERFLSRVALGIPLPVGLCTLVVLALFWNGPYLQLWLGLVALTAVRARLSLVHLRAYSLSDYAFLGKLAACLAFLVLATPWLGTLPADLSVAAVAGLGALALVVLGKSTVGVPAAEGFDLGLPLWLRRLFECRSSVQLGLVRVDRRLASQGRLLRALRSELGDARICRLSKDVCVWFTTGPERLDPSRLATQSAGTLHELEVGARVPDGHTAALAGLRSPSWERYVARHLRRAEDHALGGLEERLATLLPGARSFELGARLQALDFEGSALRELRRVLLDAARGRTGFRRIGNREVIVLAPGGVPEVLVVAPRSGDGPSWRAEATELARATELALTVERAR
jgi:hypothetical protein